MGRVGRVRPSPIDCLVAALIGIATALGIAVTQLAPAPGQERGLLAFTLLACGFAASEIFVVHVPVGSDSHSFSLGEVPLVIGLFQVTPGVLLAAAIAGGGLALLAYRRQEFTKVVFNS